MLIIFDLDDTLIETTKCLTYHYLRISFRAMQHAGLEIGEDTFDQLISINQNVLSTREGIKKFWKEKSSEKRILEAGLAALKTPIPEELHLERVPGALEILEKLQEAHTLALVTFGDLFLQQQKLKKAGIQQERFSKLLFGTGPDKKKSYQAILSELNVDPKNALVCGDRILLDLTPAKELGLFTVHFRNGRGMIHDEPQADVDFSIDTLMQLCEVFAQYES